MLEDKLSKLSPEKRALVLKKLREKKAAEAPKPGANSLPTAPRDQPIPLSLGQEGLWVVYRLDPDTPAFNIPGAFCFNGALDRAALDQALHALIQRHEVFRTRLEEHAGQTRQVIHPAVDWTLKFQDLSHLDEAQARQKARECAEADAAKPFDLGKPCYFRAHLLKLSESNHAFIFTLHHIISDAWSLGLMMADLTQLYSAFAKGQTPALPALDLQYADFALWQRQKLSPELITKQLDYWKQQLAHAPLLELPTDKKRPAVQTYNGATIPFELTREQSDALNHYSRTKGASLYMILMAAFKVLLARHTGQTDLCVGSSIAGRGHAQLAGMIGYFVNLLVMRNQLDGNPTFDTLVDRVRDTALSAFDHQDVPFEKVVDACSTKRDMSRNPLFQVLFVFHNTPRADLQLPGVTLTDMDFEWGMTKYDLTLQMGDEGGVFKGVMEYNTDLFQPWRISAMLNHFKALLPQLIAAPNRPIGDAELMARPEQDTLLSQHAPKADLTLTGGIPAAFSRMAAAHPDHTAILSERGNLTYAQLESRSNQLAHMLIAQGAVPDTPVGVCLERGPDQIVALLAILKAGGVYVPLDPSYPAERLIGMIEDTGLFLLVTEQAMLDTLPTYQLMFVSQILIDAEEEALAAESEEAPDLAIHPDQAAYIMYTSGSTGKPKGVVVPHRAVLRLVHNSNFLTVTPADIGLAMAPISFDASTLEVWAPLLNGASLFLMPAGTPSLEDLGRALLTHHITVAWMTAPLFHLMVEHHLSDLAQLRVLLAGGDVINAEHVHRLLQSAPNLTFVNGYGPTENTTFTACHVVQSPPDPTVSLPIGRPITNTSILVLDASGKPTPVGVAGRLYTGGLGLARCYHGQADMTAERFVPNPLGETGSRLYDTGDRACWLPDGTLRFMGRADHQVKIRGFRIEPGEIENALAKHPAVEAAAVVAVTDAAGDKRLTAYLTTLGEPPTTGELQDFLLEHIPDFMIPGAFVLLDAFPLTPSGKINRKILPQLSGDSLGRDIEFVEPETATEKKIAAYWCELLGADRVGKEDNFFELGGHSLLATQVISHLRELYKVELPIKYFFENPTVALIAAEVDREPGAAGGSTMIEPTPHGEPIPLSFAQERLWFLDRLEPNSAQYNVPSAVRMRGPLDQTAMERTFQTLIQRHDVLHTAFEMQDGAAVRVLHDLSDWSLTFEDLSTEADPEAAMNQRAARDAATPFALNQAPLFRAAVLRLGPDHHVLLFCMHHIICDGWSVGIIVREIATLYRAFHESKPNFLPDLEIQYGDFARWQRNYLQGEVLDKQLNFWRKQLEGLEPLELPTDMPRPNRVTHSGAHLTFHLDADLTATLDDFAKERDKSLFMVLLAAFKVLLRGYTGKNDIAVGTAIANRNRSEIESIVGFFVNSLVLRSRIQPEASFEDFLEVVGQTALNAYDHQDLPFEKVVEACTPGRDMGHTPLFQVMFVLQNAPVDVIELPDLVLEPIDLQSGAAKFDLTVWMNQTENGLHGTLEYNTDLFEATSMRRMAELFTNLLQTLTMGLAELPVSQLPLMPQDQVESLIQNPDSDYPRQAGIQSLFEATAAAHPQRTALTYEGAQLNYADLNRRANRLAHHLIGLGAGPETIIGASLERGFDQITVLLAIIKTGAAYLPLDPEYPRERLDLIVQDTQPVVILTRPQWRDQYAAERTLILEPGADLAPNQPDTNPPVRSTPNNAAYLVYTSGSTGRPKGVVAPIGAVIRLVRNTNYFDWQTPQVMVQTAPVAFDASTFEIWATLLNGGRLVIIPSGPLEPAVVAAAVKDHGVTLLWSTTQFFNNLVDQHLDDLTGVTRVVTGGEVMSPYHALNAKKALTQTNIANVYGPTENTTFTTWCDLATWNGKGSVPIGIPISHGTLLVLDKDLYPTPQGGLGQLAVAGDGLARGYYHRGGLTAEKFVPHPFAGQAGNPPGARVYLTGDVVRLNNQGQVEYLGRTDHQVKIRGFRIELGEIEAQLSHMPGVVETKVVVRDVHGDNRLAAYLVTDFEFTREDVETYLSDNLPAYMIPAYIMFLDAMPVNANGKVDTAKLPDPTNLVREGEFQAPESATEIALAEIWIDLLHVDRIDRRDSFFTLGGHSLLATRLASRVKALGVDLALRTIFEKAVLSDLAHEIDRFSDADPTHQAPVLTKAPPMEHLPLSFAQERLWFIDQLDPGSPSYNMPIALRLTGDLDLDHWQDAFADLVDRHESLRTCFITENGQPGQMIVDLVPVDMEVVDLSNAADVEAELKARLIADAHRPFDLSLPPLWRIHLYKLDPQTAVFLLNMHHIIGDGWSFKILLKQLFEAYAARITGQAPELEPDPIQYKDFAVWQRQWLQGEALDRQLAFWQNELSGANHILDLPTDHPRPQLQTNRGAQHEFWLPDSAAAQLQTFCRQQGCTPFMALSAAFAVLLARYTGVDDLNLGTPVANRNRAEIEGIVGFFVNTLVLRVDLEGRPTFTQLVDRVKTHALDAFAHQDVPFEKVVERLQPQREMSRSPLFQVMFALMNIAPEKGSQAQLDSLSISDQPFDFNAAKFDLSLNMMEAEGKLYGSFEYNTDLFKADTMARWADHFSNLLSALLEDPNQAVHQIEIMDDNERMMVLEGFQNPDPQPPLLPVLNQSVETHAAQQGRAVAWSGPEGDLTYAQLNAAANRLAARLIQAGVQIETPVGISMQRTQAMPVALIAILKAGGTYVPLDPALPEERLRYMMTDMNVQHLITQGQTPDFAADAAVFNPADDLTGAHDPGNPNLDQRDSHLAYVIYTSGSTGKPKPVGVPRGAVQQFITAITHRFQLAPTDRVMQFVTLAFDISVEEIFGTWAVGAALVPAPVTGLNADELSDFAQNHGITVLDLPTSLWHDWVQYMRDNQIKAPAGLRLTVVGGEAARAVSLNHFSSCLSGPLTWINTYGPTETTVTATTWSVDLQPNVDPAVTQIPIGRPLTSNRVYVLDDDLQPLPIGAVGELCIGGASVARGYLNRPQLTAAAFPHDPYSEQEGARLYRSGDLVHYDTNGLLYFHGRKDFQVKVRGFRIEIGEIEAVLADHQKVADVLVTARTAADGNQQLTAYLTARAQAPTVAELRDHLAAVLPAYMTPSFFVVLDSFPKTTGGKIDRNALPAPSAAALVGEADWQEPQTDWEKTICAVWADLLGLEKISAAADFFASGGHSLLATQVASRLKQSHQIDIPIRVLFEHPVASDLAKFIEISQWAAGPAEGDDEDFEEEGEL